MVPLSEYFAELTDVWRKLAYGHLIPNNQTFSTLCQNWRTTFDPPEAVETEATGSAANDNPQAQPGEGHHER